MTVTLRSKVLNNGSQSLYLDIYHNGKRRYKFLRLYLVPEVSESAKRLNANALRKAHEIKAKVVLGMDITPEIRHRTVIITLDEWLDVYAQKLDSERHVSATTKQQTRLVSGVIREYLASIRKRHIRIVDFKRKETIGFLRFLKGYKGQRGHSLSLSTLSVYQQRMVAIFNSAVHEGHITDNPINTIARRERIPKPSLCKEYLTVDEVIRVARAKVSNEQVRLAFIFACFTGIRLSDLRALRWSDVKMMNGCSGVIITQRKTRNMAIIPLSKTAMAFLPERTPDDDHVFHLPQKTWLRNSLMRILRAAGINKHITFHSSRHTFATLTIAACHDIKTVSSMLGHKSVRTTEIYAKVMIESKQQAVSKLGMIMEKE